MTETVSLLIAIGTIIIQLAIVVRIVCLVSMETSGTRKINNWIYDNILAIGFFFSLGAVLGSMFYSLVAGFAPCTLCWYQRIFLFPQVILFLIAWCKKERATALTVSFILSSIGLIIALYHLLVENGIVTSTSCDVGGVSCAKIYVTEFGYITIPVMSATIFIALLVAVAKNGIFKSKKESLN